MLQSPGATPPPSEQDILEIAALLRQNAGPEPREFAAGQLLALASAEPHPAVRAALLDRAARCVFAQDPGRALDLFRESFRLHPTPATGKRLLVLAEQDEAFARLNRLGNLIDSIADLDTDPDAKAESWLRAAQSHVQRGHGQSALVALAQLAKLQPDNSEIADLHDIATQQQQDRQALLAGQRLAIAEAPEEDRAQILVGYAELLIDGEEPLADAAAVLADAVELLTASSGTTESIGEITPRWVEVARATGDRDELAKALVACLNSQASPAQRLPLADELANLHDVDRTLPGAAHVALTVLCQALPDDQVLRARHLVTGVLAAGEGLESALDKLRADAVRERDREGEAVICLALSWVAQDRYRETQEKSELDKAERQLRRVRTLAPHNAEALNFFENWYRDSGDHKRLLVALTQRLAVSEGREVIRIASEIARLCEGPLATPDRAVEAWQRVLTVQPDQVEATTALERLYQQQGRWQALRELLDRAVRALVNRAALDASALQRAASILARVAALHDPQGPLADAALAKQAWTQVLALAPGHAQAVEASVAAANPDEAVAILEAAVAAGGDAAALVPWLLQLADVYGQQGNAAAQLAALERATAHAPNHAGVAQAWLTALRDRGDSSALLRAYLGLITAQLQQDVRQVTAADLTGRWTAGVPTTLSEYLREAAILAEELSEPIAVRLFELHLAVSPGNTLSLQALTRLCASGDQAEALAAALQAQVQAPGQDSATKCQFLSQLATLQDEVLGDSPAALATATQLHALNPHHDVAVSLLARAQVLGGQVQTARSLFADTPAGAEDFAAFAQDCESRLAADATKLRADLQTQAARALASCPDQLERAALVAGHALRSTISIGSSAGEDVKAAAQMLLDFAVKAHIAGLELEALDALCAGDPSTTGRAWRLQRIEACARVQMPEQASEYAAELAEELLVDAEIAQAIHWCGRYAELAVLAGQGAGTADRLAAWAEIAQDSAGDDASVRQALAPLWRQIAQLSIKHEDFDLAARAVQRALASSDDAQGADQPELLDIRQEIAASQGDWATVVDSLRRRASLSTGPERSQWLLRAAEQADISLHDQALVADLYAQLLAHDPASAEGRIGLARALAPKDGTATDAGQLAWQNALDQVLELSAEHQAARLQAAVDRLSQTPVDAPVPAAVLSLVREMGDVDELLDQQLELISIAQSRLDLQAKHAPLAAALLPVLERQGRDQEALICQEILQLAETDPTKRALRADDLALQLQASDPGRALDGLLPVLRVDPTAFSRWQLAADLADAAERPGEWTGLACAALGLAPQDEVTVLQDRQKAVVLGQLTVQRALGQGDRDLAAIVLRWLLELVPDRHDLHEELETLLRESNDLDALALALEQRIVADLSADDRMMSWLRLAALHSDERQSPAEALDALRRARENLPESQEVAAAVLDAIRQWDTPQALATELQLRLKQPAADVDAAQLQIWRLELADLLERGADPRAALDHWLQALDSDPGQDQAATQALGNWLKSAEAGVDLSLSIQADRLEQLLDMRGDTASLATVLQRRGEAGDGAAWQRLIALREAQQSDIAGAFTAACTFLASAPTAEAAKSAVKRLALLVEPKLSDATLQNLSESGDPQVVHFALNLWAESARDRGDFATQAAALQGLLATVPISEGNSQQEIRANLASVFENSLHDLGAALGTWLPLLDGTWHNRAVAEVLRLADAMDQGGDIDDIVRDASQWLADDQQRTAERLKLAERAYARNDFARMVDVLDLVLAQDAHHDEAFALRAAALQELPESDRWPRLADHLRLSLLRTGTVQQHQQVQVELAQILHRYLGQSAAGFALIDELLQAEPGAADASHWLEIATQMAHSAGLDEQADALRGQDAARVQQALAQARQQGDQPTVLRLLARQLIEQNAAPELFAAIAEIRDLGAETRATSEAVTRLAMSLAELKPDQAKTAIQWRLADVNPDRDPDSWLQAHLLASEYLEPAQARDNWLELGIFARDHLKDADQALQWLLQALTPAPIHSVLQALETVAQSVDSAAVATASLLDIADAGREDADAIAQTGFALARGHEELTEQARVFAGLLAASTSDQAPAQAWLEADARAQGDAEALRHHLQTRAEQLQDKTPDAAAELWLEIAALTEDVGDQIHALDAALALSPQAEAPLRARLAVAMEQLDQQLLIDLGRRLGDRLQAAESAAVATALAAQNRWPEALLAAQRVLQAEPNHAAMRVLHARALTKVGDIGAARLAWLDALEGMNDLDSVPLRVEAAALALQAEDVGDAVGHLAQVVIVAPQSAELWAFLNSHASHEGLLAATSETLVPILREVGHADLAVKIQQMALAALPASERGAAGRALASAVADDLGQHQDALDLLMDQVRDGVEPLEAIALSSDIARTGNLVEAWLDQVFDALSAEEVPPEAMSDAVSLAAGAGREAGLSSRAADLWTLVWDQDSDNLDACEATLACRRESGDAAALGRDLARAIMLGTGDVNAWRLELADIERFLGRPRQTLRLVLDVLRVDPTQSDAVALGLQLAAEPATQAEALAELEPLWRGAQQWDGVLQLLQVKLQKAQNSAAQSEIAKEITWIETNHASNLGHGVQALAAALRASPSVATWLALRHAARLPQDSVVLAEATAAVLAAPLSPSDLAQVLHYAAQQAIEAGDTKKAEGHLVTLVQGSPEDDDAFEMLETLYDAAERWTDLLGAWQSRVARLENLDRKRLGLHRVAGLARTLDKLDDAVAALRALCDLDAHDPQAHAELVDLLRDRNDPQALAASLVVLARITAGSVERADHLCEAARLQARELKNADRANDLYEEAFRADPGHDEAFVFLERQAGHEARRLEPLYALRAQHLQPGPTRTLTLRRLAQARSERGDGNGACEALRTALGDDAENPVLVDELLRIADQHRVWAAWVQAAEHRLAKEARKDGHVALQAQLIRVLLTELNDEASADKHMQLLLKSAPSDPATRHVQRLMQASSGDAQQALTGLEALLRDSKDPQEQIVLHQQLADLYATRQNNPGKAIKEYQRLLSLDPKRWAARRKLCDLYAARNSHEALAESLRQWINALADGDGRSTLRLELGGELLDLHVELGQVQLQLGQVTEATSTLRKAHVLGGDTVQLDALLLPLLQASGDFHAALQLSQWLLAHETLDDSGRFARLIQAGHAAEGAHDYAAARTHYHQALEIQVDEQEAILGCARAHLGAGDMDRAMRLFDAVARRPGTKAQVRADAFVGMGNCRLKRKQTAQARSCFEDALALVPGHKEARAALLET